MVEAQSIMDRLAGTLGPLGLIARGTRPFEIPAFVRI